MSQHEDKTPHERADEAREAVSQEANRPNSCYLTAEVIFTLSEALDFWEQAKAATLEDLPEGAILKGAKWVIDYEMPQPSEESRRATMTTKGRAQSMRDAVECMAKDGYTQEVQDEFLMLIDLWEKRQTIAESVERAFGPEQSQPSEEGGQSPTFEAEFAREWPGVATAAAELPDVAMPAYVAEIARLAKQLWKRVEQHYRFHCDHEKRLSALKAAQKPQDGRSEAAQGVQAGLRAPLLEVGNGKGEVVGRLVAGNTPEPVGHDRTVELPKLASTPQPIGPVGYGPMLSVSVGNFTIDTPVDLAIEQTPDGWTVRQVQRGPSAPGRE